MGFYQELSANNRYDKIFPMREKTVAFLKKRTIEHGAVVDVAMGTGNYANALAKDGYNVVGIEYDQSMYEASKEKLKATNVKCLLGSMEDLENMIQPSDLIFCIGNSIVHLPNKEAVRNTIKGMYNSLNKSGTLVIQMVNYDRIINHHVDHLPSISVKEDKLVFIRNYYQEQGKIAFEGIIQIDGEVVSEETVMLLPLMKDELNEMLVSAGFTSISYYGGFDESNFELDKSIPLVVSAKK